MDDYEMVDMIFYCAVCDTTLRNRIPKRSDFVICGECESAEAQRLPGAVSVVNEIKEALRGTGMAGTIDQISPTGDGPGKYEVTIRVERGED